MTLGLYFSFSCFTFGESIPVGPAIVLLFHFGFDTGIAGVSLDLDLLGVLEANLVKPLSPNPVIEREAFGAQHVPEVDTFEVSQSLLLKQGLGMQLGLGLLKEDVDSCLETTNSLAPETNKCTII